MSVNQEQLQKLIDKLVNVVKPKGVEHIDCELEPLNIRDNEYYLFITYVFPNDSPYLTKHLTGPQIRAEWNEQIKKTIKTYFGIDVIINSSSFTSKSFYNRKN